MIYIGEKKEKNKNVGYGLGGRRKREFGGLFLGVARIGGDWF